MEHGQGLRRAGGGKASHAALGPEDAQLLRAGCCAKGSGEERLGAIEDQVPMLGYLRHCQQRQPPSPRGERERAQQRGALCKERVDGHIGLAGLDQHPHYLETRRDQDKSTEEENKENEGTDKIRPCGSLDTNEGS